MLNTHSFGSMFPPRKLAQVKNTPTPYNPDETFPVTSHPIATTNSGQ